MVLEDIKTRAIAMLKIGTAVVDVAESLNISPAQVQEWNDSVEHNVAEDLVAELVIQERALEIVASGEASEVTVIEGNKLDKLQDKLHDKLLSKD